VDVGSEMPYEISLDEEMKSGSAELDISSAGVTTDSTEDELPIPQSKEESDILAAASIDSATMDERIQSTISEDVDEPDLSGVPDAGAERSVDLTFIVHLLVMQINFMSTSILGHVTNFQRNSCNGRYQTTSTS
jgi:hypothetical protein